MSAKTKYLVIRNEEANEDSIFHKEEYVSCLEEFTTKKELESWLSDRASWGYNDDYYKIYEISRELTCTYKVTVS